MDNNFSVQITKLVIFRWNCNQTLNILFIRFPLFSYIRMWFCILHIFFLFHLFSISVHLHNFIYWASPSCWPIFVIFIERQWIITVDMTEKKKNCTSLMIKLQWNILKRIFQKKEKMVHPRCLKYYKNEMQWK